MLHVTDRTLFARPILINNVEFNSVLLKYVLKPINDFIKPPNVCVVFVTIVLAHHVWVTNKDLINTNFVECLGLESNCRAVVMP